MKSQAENTTIVCGVRNRNEILAESLKNWLFHPVEEIVIVDFRDVSCESAWDVVKSNGDPRIRLVETKYEYRYNYSLALNLGISRVKTPFFTKFDVDYDIRHDFFERNQADAGTMIGGFDSRIWRFALVGFVYAPTALFREINGYHEGLHGYGCEDEDFFKRASKHVHVKIFDPETIRHKPHPEVLRVRGFLKNGTGCTDEQSRALRKHTVAMNYLLLKVFPWGHDRPLTSWKLTAIEENRWLAVREKDNQ